VVSPPTVAEILAGTWPELAADPARIAEYERALSGLDPAVVHRVATSYTRERRPLPSPAVLRIAVLARTGRADGPGDRPPAPPARPTGAGRDHRMPSRRLATTWAALTGLSALVVLSGSELPWVRLTSGTRELEIGIDDFSGVRFVPVTALAALICSLLAVVFMFRHQPVRRTRQAFGVAIALHAIAIAGAMRGVGQVMDLRDELTGVAAADPTFGPVPDIAIAAGLWQALVGAAAGLGIAVLGYRGTRVPPAPRAG